ncbi:MAG: hypothetical protein WAM82_14555 [Thermoanaerobaculia bacterium]
MAKKVLTEPILSDSLFSRFKDVPILKSITSRWRIASAISAQDLVHGLKKIAADKTTDSDTATSLNTMLSEIDPETARNAEMVEKLVQQVAPGASDKADAMIKQLQASTQKAVGKVEVWFNRAMDRASQRFAIQMRLWTVAFAVLLAFGAHIDSFHVLQELWASPATRSNLVASRDAVIQEATVVLSPTATPDTEGASPAVPPSIVNAAMKNLQSQNPALAAPPVFNSYNDALTWLNQNAPANQKEVLVAQYQKLVLGGLTSHFDSIKKTLDDSGLAIIPSPLPKFWCFNGWRNFAGILATAAFLSLGAPFWFNALKTLSNLRPLVASKQDAPKPAG